MSEWDLTPETALGYLHFHSKFVKQATAAHPLSEQLRQEADRASDAGAGFTANLLRGAADELDAGVMVGSQHAGTVAELDRVERKAHRHRDRPARLTMAVERPPTVETRKLVEVTYRIGAGCCSDDPVRERRALYTPAGDLVCTYLPEDRRAAERAAADDPPPPVHLVDSDGRDED